MKATNKLFTKAISRKARKKTATTKDRASEAAQAAGRAASATGQATADAAKATAQGAASGAQAASRATARGGLAVARAAGTAVKATGRGARSTVGRVARAGAAATGALRGQPTGADFVDSLYATQQGRCHGCDQFTLRGDLRPGPVGENGEQWALYCADCAP
ncbi:MAG: hypothetical protein F4Z31_02265 [Gemmatimonadetes bacterium]|nr:hypothetical protein [Gemmatimonadota bacterium]